MPETSIPPPALPRSSKPVSEALLNEKVRLYLYHKAFFVSTFYPDGVANINSGITASRHFLSALHLASASALSSRYCYLNEEHGLLSSVLGSELEEHMRSVIAISWGRGKRESGYNDRRGDIRTWRTRGAER